MVDDYCMSKAEEALSTGGGDHRRAAKLLRDWAKDDLDLQAALLQPFLGSLCALAIQRAAAKRARARQQKLSPATESPGVDMAEVVRMALGGKSPAGTPKPAWTPTNRKRQEQAIHTIAAAYRAKPPRER